MFDVTLNFNESLSPSNILNFGAVDKDEDVLIYYYDFDLEFSEYESLFVALDKLFIDDKQEVKTIRVSLLNRSTLKASKRYFGSPVKPGTSERYVFEAVYSRHTGKLSQEEFKQKYLIRLEVLVTDVDKIGSTDITKLVTNFKFYLKRGKRA